jgi:hypothetical protein
MHVVGGRKLAYRQAGTNHGVLFFCGTPAGAETEQLYFATWTEAKTSRKKNNT